MMKRKDDLPIIFKLGETTWRVLLVILSIREPIGPRELSRRLNFSSPSVGLYHLEKLKEEDLVHKTRDGDYIINTNADFGFLENYLFYEQGALPRITMYATFVTFLMLAYGLFIPFDFSAHNIFALVVGWSAATFFWREFIRYYRTLK